MADVDAGEKVRAESRFRIASISKPITAAGVLLLVRDQKLTLDSKVVELLGLDCKDPRWSRITIRHLLQHSGGWDRDVSYDAMFRSVQIAESLGKTPPATAEQVIEYMSQQPLDFDPGQRYAYSNFGYCLLGRVIERLSKLDYETFTKQRVLAPMGIRRMQIGRTLPAHRAANEVRYYDDSAETRSSVFPPVGEQVPGPYGAWHLEAMDSHGAWIGSASEVCLFGAKLGELLRPEEIQHSFARPAQPLWSDPDQQKYFYGFGWLVRPVQHSNPVAPHNTWHTGSLPGTGTLLVRRWDGFSWAVLFNKRNSAINGERLTSLIDPKLHEVADQVKSRAAAP